MMIALLQSLGKEGIPIQYIPRTDDFMALIILICFFISAFVLSRSKKHLLLQMKSFFNQRDRASIFDSSNNVDLRFLILMLLQTCIFSGLFVFNYCDDTYPGLMNHVSPYLLLGIYIAGCACYLLFKWLIYLFVGWIFFDKNKTSLWISSYFTLSYYFGFVLFPFVLLLIYFDLRVVYLIIIGLILLFCVKILMFYKWLKLFFNNLGGLLLLILYFCALEIIPCFLLFRGMLELNNLLIIKI